MHKYAFFDVDQTIYPGYSMADFYHTPAVKSLLGPDFYLEDLAIGQLYKSGQITYAEAGARAARLCASSVKGQSTEIVAKLASDFVQSHGLKPFVSSLFSLLRQSNYIIILVSGSVDFIIQAIANHTNADLYHATSPELDTNNIYTGNITHQLDDVEKAKIIKQNYNLDQASVLSFGDSTGDIPMLSLAKHAFIINPHQPELYKLAEDNHNYHLVEEGTILNSVNKIISQIWSPTLLPTSAKSTRL